MEADNLHTGDNLKIVAIKLIGNEDHADQPGEVAVEVYSKKKRLNRMIISLLVCLLVIAACAVIPILHFFLVPLAVLAAPFAVFLYSRQKSAIFKGEGRCPYCKAAFTIFRRPDKFPFFDICTQCNRQIEIARD